MRVFLPVVASAVLLLACSDPAPLLVLVTPGDRALVDRFFEFTPIEGMEISESGDPAGGVSGSGFRVALARGLEGCPCEPGSFRVDGEGGQYVVRADDVLGLQYGLSQVLEAAGVRFFHPRRRHLPSPLAAPASVPGDGGRVQDALAILEEPDGLPVRLSA